MTQADSPPQGKPRGMSRSSTRGMAAIDVNRLMWIIALPPRRYLISIAGYYRYATNEFRYAGLAAFDMIGLPYYCLYLLLLYDTNIPGEAIKLEASAFGRQSRVEYPTYLCNTRHQFSTSRIFLI